MHVHAYDCLDQVHIAVSIRESDESGTTLMPWTALASTTIQGSGETDRRAWVQDALIAALERL